ncbi:hypothetical protein GQ600_12486 [Phytophthora cactorum]|nr:hypothetical protein GQ600_12486 [Phytophthora cactorum]
MCTSFLDWKDKQLVQIALEFDKEAIRVTWVYVARCMTKSQRTASESASGRRFLSSGRCLPRTKNLCSLPAVPPPPARAPVVPTPRRGSAGDTEEEPTADALLEQLTTLLTVPDAISVVTTMFSNITTSDIRQESAALAQSVSSGGSASSFKSPPSSPCSHSARVWCQPDTSVSVPMVKSNNSPATRPLWTFRADQSRRHREQPLFTLIFFCKCSVDVFSSSPSRAADTSCRHQRYAVHDQLGQHSLQDLLRPP